MLKVLLSATLISVVWSGSYPAYQTFFDDSYGLIDDDALRSEHSSPIYQTYIDYNDEDDEHFDLIVDDDVDPRRKYEQKTVDVIPPRAKYATKGRKTVSKTGNYKAPEAAEEVKIKKQSYQAAKLTQEEIEVKSIGQNYGNRVSNENKQASYKGQKTEKSIPATEKPVLQDGDYSSGIGQADAPKYPSVTEQKTVEVPSEVQQKDVDVDFKSPAEDKKVKGGYPVPHITYDTGKKEDSYTGTDGNKAYAVFMKNKDYKKVMSEIGNKAPIYSTINSPRRPHQRPSLSNNPVYREHSTGPRYNHIGINNHGPRGSDEYSSYGGGSTLYEGIGSLAGSKPRLSLSHSPNQVSSYNHYPQSRSNAYPGTIGQAGSHGIRNSYSRNSGHNYGSSGLSSPSTYQSFGGHPSRQYPNYGSTSHPERTHNYPGVKTPNGIGSQLPNEYLNSPKYPSYPESSSSRAAGKARPIRPPVRNYQIKAPAGLPTESTYQGIGEASPLHRPKPTIGSKTKLYPVEQKILPSEPSKYPGVKGGDNMEQQKVDNSEINYEGIGEVKPQSVPEQHSIGEIKSSIPTYKGAEQVKIDSTPEYSGIGEIKSSSGPAAKGGSKGRKGGVKTENAEYSAQKGPSRYLPVTAVHSSGYKGDSPSDPPSPPHATTDPPQVEQKELVYEAFLAGQGSQNQGRGSGGYGFLPTGSGNSGSGSGSGGYGAENDHENPPPMPYEFNFEVKDDEHGGDQFREEKMDDNGYLTGRYGYKDAEGIYREVEYQADKDGFRAQVKTNEPGTDNQDPADVHFEVERNPQHQY